MTEPAEKAMLPDSARPGDPGGGRSSAEMEYRVPFSTTEPPPRKSEGPSGPVLLLRLTEVPGIQAPTVKH